MTIEECLQLRVRPTAAGALEFIQSTGTGERFVRVKRPFFCVVEVIRDLVCSVAQRFLDSGIPVGFDQVLEIPTVSRSRVGNIC